MNEVEIVVKSDDKSHPEEVQKRWQRAMKRMVGDTKDSTGDQRSLLGRFIKGAESDADNNEIGQKLGHKLLGGLKTVLSTGMSSIAVSVASLFSASFLSQLGGGLISGVTHLLQGLGSAAALLPAALLAGGLAAGTLKIGLLGVGDALKAGLSGDTEAFKESLKGLAPEAQAAVKEFVGLKAGLGEVKAGVQGNMFAPLIGEIRPLGDTYLPVVGGALMDIAANFGVAGRNMAEWLRSTPVVQQIQSAVNNASEAVGNMTQGLGGLAAAFLPLVEQGSTFLPSLTSGFAGATARLAEFMQKAADTGQIQTFIQRGIDALQGMWGTAKRVWGIFKELKDIAGTVFGGLQFATGDLVGKLEGLVHKVHDFVDSAQGAKVIQGIFDGLKLAVFGLGPSLLQVFTLARDALGPFITDIARAVSAFAQLAGAIISTGLDALAPALAVIVPILDMVLNQFSNLAEFLARNQEVLQAVGIAIGVILIPAFIAWAIAAGTAALSTLLLWAPIILIGAAIAALAYLIIHNWDTIKAATAVVWHFIGDLIQSVWQGIQNGVSSAMDWVKNAMSSAKDWIVNAWNSVVSFVTGIPGRIGSAISGMWNGLLDGFRNVINRIIGFWNGLGFTLPTIHIPEVNIPGFGKIGGGSFGGQTFSTPNIGYLASGGIRSGLAVVGERGRELVDLGASGKVRNHGETEQLLGRGGGNHTENHFHIAGSILTERDLRRILKDHEERGGKAA